jgi:hypothetical protein
MNAIQRDIILSRGKIRYARKLKVIRPFTDRSVYEEWKSTGVERPFLDFFLRPTVTLTPSWEADSVKEFLSRGVDVTSQKRLSIRLDDREHETNSSRPYAETLSEDELEQHLSRPRFTASSLPDAHRRLISVRNLNVGAITTLAKTALFHQVGALNDALWKHTTSETSFKVHEPLDGFVTPRLEFHMPYLALRKESEVRLDGSEDWKDITFLDRASANQNTPERLLIYVAHVSIVLCIWDHKTWTITSPGLALSLNRPTKIATVILTPTTTMRYQGRIFSHLTVETMT